MIKTRKLTSIDDLELKEATFQNKVFPAHYHDTYSIGLIKEGAETICIEDKSYIATANTVVIVNQHEIHSNCFYNADSWTYQTFSLNQDVLNFFCKRNNLTANVSIHFENIIEDKQLVNLLLNFHSQTEANAALNLNQIISHLVSYHLKKKTERTPHYPHYNSIITEAKFILTQQLQEKNLLEELAQKFNINSFQLIRAFKAHTGLTPIAFLTLERLTKAKELLLQNHPLAAIANDCGFYDQSHFTNSFKKQFGTTPLAYLNNYSIIKH
jgi:AraC-like DNA-binding protein